MPKEINGKVPVIGFIGIGNMGGKMSRMLLRDGYPMLIYDTDKEKLENIKSEGAMITTDGVDVVNRSDIVMTSVTLQVI